MARLIFQLLDIVAEKVLSVIVTRTNDAVSHGGHGDCRKDEEPEPKISITSPPLAGRHRQESH